MRALSAPERWLPVLALLTLPACGIEISDPPDVELQVIEELNFSPVLNVDLDAMELTSTGMYLLDVEVGEGDPVVSGDRIRVYYEGFLFDGTVFDVAEHTFTLGNGEVIAGFEQGMLGMKIGGARRLIIPPALAFGDQPSDNIPAGSVLIFDVELRDILG